MKEWKTVSISEPITDVALTARLNELTKDGWELTFVVVLTGNYTVTEIVHYFSRRTIPE